MKSTTLPLDSNDLSIVTDVVVHQLQVQWANPHKVPGFGCWSGCMIMVSELPSQAKCRDFSFRFGDMSALQQADYIALSFVQCAADIVECRTAFDKFHRALRGNCCGYATCLCHFTYGKTLKLTWNLKKLLGKGNKPSILGLHKGTYQFTGVYPNGFSEYTNVPDDWMIQHDAQHDATLSQAIRPSVLSRKHCDKDTKIIAKIENAAWQWAGHILIL